MFFVSVDIFFMCLCVLLLYTLTFCGSDLARCQVELAELAQLIQRLHWLEGGLPITSTDLEMRISMQVSPPSFKKINRIMFL